MTRSANSVSSMELVGAAIEAHGAIGFVTP